MMLVNNTGSTIPAIILSLNPGLEIKSLSLGGANTAFKREAHIINISQSIASGDSVECSLVYEGKIDEAYCYLELDAETMQNRSSGYQNSFSFVEPEYLLLTPETNWYPVSGVSYSSSNPEWMHPDFTRFSLEISDPSPLKAISQGTESSNGSAVIFRPDHPMPFISLAMGKYQKLTGTADSIEFQLAFHPGHDYFKDAFPDIKDTIVSIISSRLQDYERRTNLNYPYKRFTIVEVPVQFTSFQHVWAGGFENVQPEIIFLPEKGAGIREANILGNLKNFKRMEGRGEETISEKDLQIRVLNNFCNLFINDQAMPIGKFKKGKVTFTERINRYNMFPMLFSYSSFFTSAELPFFNRILESYLKNTFSEGRGTMMRQMSGTTGDEKANMVLQEKSFAQVLNDPGQTAIIDNVIALKADVLFSAIKARSGKEEFEKFLYAYIDSNQYTVTTFKEFESEINSRFNIDLNAYITEWLNSKELPGFLFGPVVANKVRTDQMVKTMVQFKVSNLENVNGMIKIVFRFGGGGSGQRGGGGGMSFGGGDAGNTVEKFVTLSGNQTKSVCFLLDSEPRAMIISTLTSKNIPMEIINTFRKIEPNRNKIPFEGEVIENDVVNLVQPGEIVMDNEDPGFEIIQPENKGAFVRLLARSDETTDKYAPLVTFRIPENWKLTTNSFFYGKYVRSAYYVRKGEGDRKARWNIPIQTEGYYNVYFYLDLQLLQQNRMAIFARQNRSGGQGGADRGEQRGNEQKVEGQYQFIIHHDGGEETITINLADIEGGWNSLGSFFFNPEKAVIELTNKGEGQMMIADAVKLIKEQE